MRLVRGGGWQQARNKEIKSNQIQEMENAPILKLGRDPECLLATIIRTHLAFITHICVALYVHPHHINCALLYMVLHALLALLRYLGYGST
jgi:hypothetical protein